MATGITRYHARYYAALLTQQQANGDLGSLSQLLLSATVDINPHQIDAALFAFSRPMAKGVAPTEEEFQKRMFEEAWLKNTERFASKTPNELPQKHRTICHKKAK